MRSTTGSAGGVARVAAARLSRAGVPEPEASAEVLLSELLDVQRGELHLQNEPLTDEQAARYEAWISCRADREPVQRILGRAYFRNLVLDLNEETLIPRPDTESVVDAALERLDRRGGSGRVLDIGTGSGAIAIAIAQERPSAEVHATDTSKRALEIAHRNAQRAKARVAFHETDLASGLDLARAVDVLVSNPPYIESDAVAELAPEVRDWDPPSALDGGPDGLTFYRRIFAETPPLLAEGASVVLEIGDGQGQAVPALGRAAGFDPLGVRLDLTGTLRAALLRWPGWK